MRRFVCLPGWWLRAVLLCLVLPVTASAQPAPAPAAGERPPPPPESATAWDRMVYVPFRNLRQILTDDSGSVLVPLSRYIELWDKTRAAELLGSRPAVAAVLAQASYTGIVQKDLARVTAEFTVRVFASDGAAIPLEFGDAALGKLTTDDPGIVLQAIDEGRYELRLPAAGEHVVKLEILQRVRTSPDGRQFELVCPPAVINRVDLQVPGTDQALELVPAPAGAELKTEDNVTRLTAHLGATRKLAARWRPRLGTAPAMEVLTAVSNLIDVRIADGVIHTEAQLTYKVLRGSVDKLQIAVAAGSRVLDVTAPGLKSWQTEVTPVGQMITVDLLSSEAKSIDVRVHTESSLPNDAFDLAGITAAGLVHGVHSAAEGRENGVLVVSATADLSLSVEQQQGLVRIETAEVPEPSRRPESFAWRYFNPRFELKMSAIPVEPEIKANRTSRLVFREDEIASEEKLTLQVERPGVFELRFGLPDGYLVDQVKCDAMKEYQTLDGKNELVVTLRQRTQGTILVEIAGRMTYQQGPDVRTTLPLVALAKSQRDEGELRLFAQDSLEVIADEKSVEGVQPASPRNVAAPPGTRLLARWNFTVRPEIIVRTERRLPRMTAAVATTIGVRQDVVEVDTELSYNVRFAGIETIRFAVPEAVAGSVQVSAGPSTPGIQQQSREGDPIDGWVIWRVVLQREVLGAASLNVHYDLKPERQGPRKQASFAISPLRILPSPESPNRPVPTTATSIEGELRVERDRALSVGATAPAVFESIDVRELTKLGQQGDLAYRWFAQPAELSMPMEVVVSSAQLEIQEVVETVVARAALEAVVTEDSKITCRTRYFLKSSERQRLSISLPKDAVALDAIVAGKRVELERLPIESTDRRWDSYRINVQRETSAETPFVIALVYQAPYNPRPLPGRGGNLQINIPRLGEDSDQVVTQELRAALWLPREFAIVGEPEGFTPRYTSWISFVEGAKGYRTETGDLDRWFGESLGGLFAFQTAGRAYQYSRLGESTTLTVAYWRVQFFTWCISGALFCAGVLLARTSWNNRLTVLVLLTFALALLAVQDLELVLHVLGAGRFGMAAVMGWWIVQSVTTPRKMPRRYRITDPATAVSLLAAVIPPPEAPAPQTAPVAPDNRTKGP